MQEISLDAEQTFDVKIKGIQFKVKEPMLMDLQESEQDDKKITRTIELLKNMGVPDDLLKQLTASQTGDVCKQLLGLFQEKKQ